MSLAKNPDDAEEPKPPTITLHPGEILRNIAESLNHRHDDLAVTLPVNTTLKEALQATQDVIQDIDEPIVLMPGGIHDRKIRELATINPTSDRTSESPGQITGQEIGTSAVLHRNELLLQRTPEMRARLRKMAKENMEADFLESYIARRELTERVIHSTQEKGEQVSGNI